MLKALATVSVLVVLVTLLFIAGLDHIFTASDREQRKHDAEWLAFSMQHHCTVARPATFWEVSKLWNCDGGFQVLRRDNE